MVCKVPIGYGFKVLLPSLCVKHAIFHVVDKGFTVKIGQVEGPLDLILTLIEERKMLVSDLSLAQIAEDFVAYVRSQTTFPAGTAAQFILTAATLLLLKSKALLPIFSLTEDEEGDIKDLERRLALLSTYRAIAKKLAALLGSPLYFGGLARDNNPIFAPSKDMTVLNLADAARTVLSRAPTPIVREEVEVKKVVSLEEMMGRLATRIEKALSLTFKDFVGSPNDRREIVVGFLAILELVKRGLVNVEQDTLFTDIKMQYAGDAGAPRYE